MNKEPLAPAFDPQKITNGLNDRYVFPPFQCKSMREILREQLADIDFIMWPMKLEK